MDLRNGIITLNGFDLTPETVPEALHQRFPDVKMRERLPRVSFSFGRVCVEETVFLVNISFSHGRPGNMKLTPVLSAEDMKKTMQGQQEVRRQICDAWLKELLGRPNKQSPEVTSYSLYWGDIQAVSSLGGKSPYEAGFIQIFYKQR